MTSAALRMHAHRLGWLTSMLALFCSTAAQAWGPAAHRIVAQLAEGQLQADARVKVRQLLTLSDARHLSDIANWADDLREDPDQREFARATARLHYVNFADSACRFEADRICANGQCVVAAIDHYAAILADGSRPLAERAEALRFVVHFVGDVHQPLHAGYRPDRGGNHMQVRIDEARHQHAAVEFDHLGVGADALGRIGVGADEGDGWSRHAERLARMAPLADASEDPVAWARQSCRLTRDAGIYPDSRNIDSAYLERMRPLAERQMRLAGKRLANVLNRALD